MAPMMRGESDSNSNSVELNMIISFVGIFSILIFAIIFCGGKSTSKNKNLEENGVKAADGVQDASMEPEGGKKATLDLANLLWPNLPTTFLRAILKSDGQFLLRTEKSTAKILSIRSGDEVRNFLFSGEKGRFKSSDEWLKYHFESGLSVSQDAAVIATHPIYRPCQLFDQRRLVFGDVLGKGNFASVLRAQLSPSNEVVAMKLMINHTNEIDKADAIAEAILMGPLHHANIVALNGITFVMQPKPHEYKLGLILEFCAGGTLEEALHKGSIDGRGMIRALSDVAKGLAYLHSRLIIHRDVASRNCLLSIRTDGSKITKLSDLGLSRKTANGVYTAMHRRQLPVYSTAPEAHETERWTLSADVFAFGMMILEVFNDGKNPYKAHFANVKMNSQEGVAALKNGFRLKTTPPKMPASLFDSTMHCLDGKEANRPTMLEMCKTIGDQLMRMTKN